MTPKTYVSSYSATIKDILRKKNITQRQLAKKIGMSSVNLCNILNGKTAMTLDNLDKIASALGMRCVILLQKVEQ